MDRRLDSDRRHTGPDELLDNTRRQWIGDADEYGIGLIQKASKSLNSFSIDCPLVAKAAYWVVAFL
jgi:hypothetical protein